jgi:DNA-binding protein H-NS
MPTHNLNSMSVDALLKLKAEIEQTLSSRATQLRNELSKLDRSKISGKGVSALKGKKVPVKYRHRSGNTWAGKGQKPRWLVAKLKAGAKLRDSEVKR